MFKNQVKNPFGVSTYIGSEYFCDRENETKMILDLLKNGNSVTLYSQRRLGKTGLIQHLFSQLPQGYEPVYIDILSTRSIEDFLEKITSSLLTQFPQKAGIGKKVWNFILSLRPTINFDPLTGLPQASFSVENSKAEKSIESILNFLENQNFTTIIAIDEFQQINEYENSIDGWLRSIFQHLKNIRFIFSGSKQHMMIDLFNSPQRPFYRSTNLIKLGKIDNNSYSNFIDNMFQKFGKSISESTINNILKWTDTHTFYVQQLCNRIFMSSEKIVEEDEWKTQANQLLIEQQDVFYSIRQLLTKKQWLLLTSIADNDRILHPTSHSFLKKYGLPSSATVTKALSYLIDKGFVYKDYDEAGNLYYAVYDLYLRRWSQQNLNKTR